MVGLLPNGYFPDDGSRCLFLGRPLAGYGEDDLRRIIAWMGRDVERQRLASESKSGRVFPSQPISQDVGPVPTKLLSNCPLEKTRAV